jgi:outer membrane protein OmpA-like peptidoglycan-associated protein
MLRNGLVYGLALSLLCSCAHPPYNNFRPHPGVAKKTVAGVGVGAAAGILASHTLTGTLVGGVIGGAVGGAIGLHQASQPYIIKQLQKQSIQFLQYGDTVTLVVPTDKYFLINSARLNELCYPGLNNIVRLLTFYPKVPIYVVGFTDNVGSTCHKIRMSKARAETMMSFLWANGIQSHRLKTIGYGEYHNIADNAFIHSSAYNRRIEIQWVVGTTATTDTSVSRLTK